MNNFVWTNFGRLISVSKSSSMVLIENDLGKVLKMSLNRYKDSAISVYQKAEQLINKTVIVRTSQNTSNWDSAEWFSDLKAEQEIKKSSNVGDFVGDEDEIPQKNRCFNWEGKGYYLYDGDKKNICSNCNGSGIKAEVRAKKQAQETHQKQKNKNTFIDNKADGIPPKNRCLSCTGKGFYLYGGGKRNICTNCEGTGIRTEVRMKDKVHVFQGGNLQENNNSTTYPTDYSNSFVDFDLGRINTKFWNGN